MKSLGMKSAVIYLALVGLPVAGVLGIVRLGRNLKPPISMGGDWNIELSPPTAGKASCSDLADLSHALVLTVSQSGRHLILSFSDPKSTQLVGEIQGQSITARSLQSTAVRASGSTSNTIEIEMRAGIERHPEFDRLDGTLAVPGCGSHGQLSFTGTRLRNADKRARAR